jgi:hypothetical protein
MCTKQKLRSGQAPSNPGWSLEAAIGGWTSRGVDTRKGGSTRPRVLRHLVLVMAGSITQVSRSLDQAERKHAPATPSLRGNHWGLTDSILDRLPRAAIRACGD